MAILDVTNLFSDAQVITASAASTNYLDRGANGVPATRGATALKYNLGAGEEVPLLVQVVEAFNTLTSLTIALETDDNAAFASPKVIASYVVPLASLVLGYRLPLQFIPTGVDERYVRLNYTVTGTAPTLGKITAGITLGENQSTIPHL